MTVFVRLSLVLVAPLVIAACGRFVPGSVETTPQPDDRYPDVIAAQLRASGERLYDISVTISSPYDSPQRYADGWRVLDPDGNVLGTHTLLHDHANEQPFTRTQRGVGIPAGITRVTVEGRDRANGFGGATLTIEVPE